MKCLYLLRHATPEPRGEDDTRPLTGDGWAEAREIGRQLREHATPQLVLCSSAQRAVQTLAGVEQGIGKQLPVRHVPALYLATAEELLARIEEQDDEHDTLMLVGHNPGMGRLAYALLRHGESEARRALARGMQPATLVALRFELDRWVEIGPGAALSEGVLRPGV